MKARSCSSIVLPEGRNNHDTALLQTLVFSILGLQAVVNTVAWQRRFENNAQGTVIAGIKGTASNTEQELMLKYFYGTLSIFSRL